LAKAGDSWSGVSSAVAAEEISHSDLRRLYPIWNQKCSSRRYPAPGEVTPRDMLHVLDRITLVEVRRDPLPFYWRVVGGWWRDRFGAEGTGMYADQWIGISTQYVA